MHKFNVRIIAVLLLLVFTQGMGLRLVLHNTLHTGTVKQTTTTTSTAATNIQLACDCLDEALTPILHEQPYELQVPEKTFAVILQQHQVFLPRFAKIFHSLRAPPAV